MEPPQRIPEGGIVGQGNLVYCLIFSFEGRGVGAVVPLAPRVLQGEAVLDHSVVHRVIVRLSVCPDEGGQMILFLVETVARQCGEVALKIEVFPLSTVFLHEAGVAEGVFSRWRRVHQGCG